MIKKYHYEYGYEPEQKMPEAGTVYEHKNKLYVREYVSGIGFQQKHKIIEMYKTKR